MAFTRMSFSQQPKQFAFSHYSTINGVSSNFINTITQDETGFIWVGTPNGLQRYDGHRFVTFKHEIGNPHSLPTDNVSVLFSRQSRDLWIATADNKIGIFKTGSKQYEEIAIDWKPSYNLYITKKFFTGPQDQLFLLILYEGLFVFDRDKKRFVSYRDKLPWPKGWKVADVSIDPVSHKFWLSADSGLAVYDPATKLLCYRGHNPCNDPVINYYQKYTNGLSLLSSGNRFIFSTWPPFTGIPAITSFDRKENKFFQHEISNQLKIGYHEIYGITRQKNGRIWFYGMPLLAEIPDSPHTIKAIRNEYKDEQSIKFDKINYVFEDRETNLWLCSNNGIYMFNPDQQPFDARLLERPGEAASEGPVQFISEMKNGQIWVGSWGRGLFAYDRQFKPLPLPKPLQHIVNNYSTWSLLEEENSGRIWIGMQGGKLGIYDSSTGSYLENFFPEFSRSTIRQLAQDKSGNLWFGTQRGDLIKWDRQAAGNDPSKGYKLIMKIGLVVKLFTDSRGMVWAATEARGLTRIDPSTNKVRIFNTTLPTGFRLSGDSPSDIIQYDDSTLMVANGPVDIINLNTSKIRSITTAEGLPSNNVLCLQKDESGMLWLGMLNGLYRMNLKSNIATTYDRRDGTGFDNFVAAGAFKFRDGNLAFGTDHDFMIFQPEKLSQKEPPPYVKILDFKLGGHSLPVDSILALNRITLEPSKNSISIDFGTLSFLRKNKKAFYYKLENIDDDWVQADERHQAIYNYLPPGNYSFQVKTVNGYGIPSSTTRLLIFVKSPFWNTWWFYALLVLIVLGIFYIIDRERLRRLLTLQQMRRQIAGNLHQEINKTLSNIHLLSEIAKIKADKDLEKSIEYIDQINTKSSKMMDAMDDMLWSLDPKNDSMLKTLERMNEFAEGLKHSHGCEINLVVDEKVNTLKLDMKQRHDIYFIFKETLSHIVGFSNCTDTIVDIDMVNQNLLIKIHDNGNNLDTKQIRSSPAIQEIKKRAEDLNALLDIQSDKKGTTVLLEVPIF